jgi:hypothetical protein
MSGHAPGVSPSTPFPAQRIDSAGKILPFNEISLEPALEQYVSRLKDAVNAKDVDYLKTAIGDSTYYTTGGNRGWAEFMKFWKLENSPDQSPLWTTLEDVISLSGAFYGIDRSLFVAPYYFTVWPQDLDPGGYGVIVGEEVRLQSAPSLDAEAIDTLRYDIVQYVGNHSAETTIINGKSFPWYEVETLDSKKGWVYGQFFRSPQGYRIGFRNTGGNWRIIFFVTSE